MNNNYKDSPKSNKREFSSDDLTNKLKKFRIEEQVASNNIIKKYNNNNNNNSNQFNDNSNENKELIKLKKEHCIVRYKRLKIISELLNIKLIDLKEKYQFLEQECENFENDENDEVIEDGVLVDVEDIIDEIQFEFKVIDNGFEEYNYKINNNK